MRTDAGVDYNCILGHTSNTGTNKPPNTTYWQPVSYWLEFGHELDLWGKPASFWTETLLESDYFGVGLTVYSKATANKYYKFDEMELLIYY